MKLREKLKKLDPERLETMNQSDRKNPRRLVRAIEIALNVKCQMSNVKTISKEVVKAIEGYELDHALAIVWNEIKKADVFINKKAVWNLKGKQKEAALTNLVNRIRQIAIDLKPFLPETAEKIEELFKGPRIISAKPLFPRLR